MNDKIVIDAQEPISVPKEVAEFLEQDRNASCSSTAVELRLSGSGTRDI